MTKRESQQLIAFCWASGRIDFGHVLPDGCLPIAQSLNDKALRDKVAGMARHAYPPDDYLIVPGVPEAKGHKKKLDALHAFSARVKDSLGQSTGAAVRVGEQQGSVT
jgi:hypothetical protein